MPENAGSLLLRIQPGRIRLLDQGTADAEISLAIEDLSSLLSGTVDFRSLFHYGLAEISNHAYVDAINRLFAVEQKPMCVTGF